MCVCLCVCLFFFSSRRRHTRSFGDWSSDVCSSDLRFSRSYDRRPRNNWCTLARLWRYPSSLRKITPLCPHTLQCRSDGVERCGVEKIYEGGTVTRMTRPHPPDENGLNVAKALMGSQQVPPFSAAFFPSRLDSPQGPVGSFHHGVGRCVRNRLVHRADRRRLDVFRPPVVRRQPVWVRDRTGAGSGRRVDRRETGVELRYERVSFLAARRRAGLSRSESNGNPTDLPVVFHALPHGLAARSEERRVGKEC